MYVNMFIFVASKLTEIYKQQFNREKISHKYFHPKMPNFQEKEFGFSTNFCLLFFFIISFSKWIMFSKMSLFRCQNYTHCQNNIKKYKCQFPTMTLYVSNLSEIFAVSLVPCTIHYYTMDVLEENSICIVLH